MEIKEKNGTKTVENQSLTLHKTGICFHSQFWSIGVNYNQIVKMLYHNFSEIKAAAFLYKLEKQTAEMTLLCQRIIQLTEEFEAEHLKKNKGQK